MNRNIQNIYRTGPHRTKINCAGTNYIWSISFSNSVTIKTIKTTIKTRMIRVKTKKELKQ